MNTFSNSDFESLLLKSFSNIAMIRSDTWPLLTELPSQSQQIQNLANSLAIPDFLIVEILSLLQWFGFIDWRTVSICPDALSTPSDRVHAILERSSRKVQDTNNIEVIMGFFRKLSQNKCISTINSLLKTKKDFPFWIFRFTSLFDIDIQKFANIEQFLDFLLLNLQEQEKFFIDSLVNSFEQNWWMPVDHIPEKSSLFLSKSEFELISSGKVLGQDVGVALRIIPWFWPPWILFALSLNLPTSSGENSTENMSMTIGLRFEQIEWNTVPVIHTIQNFLHNIGINIKTWKMLTVSEWALNMDERLLNESEKRKVKWSFDLIFSGNSSQLFLACVSELLFDMGYKEIQIIDWEENLWLMEHNPKRWAESIQKSAQALYQDNGVALWWIIHNNGRVHLSRMGVARYISQNTDSATICEKFFQAYARLSRKQQFQTIEDEIIDNPDTQDFIGEFVWKERQRLLDSRIFIS